MPRCDTHISHSKLTREDPSHFKNRQKSRRVQALCVEHTERAPGPTRVARSGAKKRLRAPSGTGGHSEWEPMLLAKRKENVQKKLSVLTCGSVTSGPRFIKKKSLQCGPYLVVSLNA